MCQPSDTGDDEDGDGLGVGVALQATRNTLCMALPCSPAKVQNSLWWPFASVMSPVCPSPLASSVRLPVETIDRSPVGGQDLIHHETAWAESKPKASR